MTKKWGEIGFGDFVARNRGAKLKYEDYGDA
jgi:hypothetical protein